MERLRARLVSATRYFRRTAGRRRRLYLLILPALTIAAAAAFLLLLRSIHARLILRQAHFDDAGTRIFTVNERVRALIENGEAFAMPHQGQSSPPWLSDKVAMDGTRSLGLAIGASAPGQTSNDRSEFTIVQQDDPRSLHLGQERYLGFAILFDGNDFPPPTAELIVCQVWQAYKTVPAGPPAFIAMVPHANDLRFRLATRNDSDPKSVEVPLTHASFVRGVWNSVVLHVLPRAIGDPLGPGQIEMWLNGSYIGGARRAWGYAVPDSVDAFDVRVGLYANPQPAAHALFIDRLRWGLSKSPVDPGLAPVKPATVPPAAPEDESRG